MTNEFHAPDGVDPLAHAAQRRHEIDLAIRQLAEQRAACDAYLVANQGEQKASYGDVTISVAMPTRSTFDVDGFMAEVADMELGTVDLLALLSAAKGFSRADLIESLQAAYDRHVTPTNGKPYIRSTPTPPRQRG